MKTPPGHDGIPDPMAGGWGGTTGDEDDE